VNNCPKLSLLLFLHTKIWYWCLSIEVLVVLMISMEKIPLLQIELCFHNHGLFGSLKLILWTISQSAVPYRFCSIAFFGENFKNRRFGP